MENVSSQSGVTPRSRTAEENVRREKATKATDKAAMSKRASCWRVPSQMNCVLAELCRSQLEDIQASKTPMMKGMARVVAIASEAEQCK